MDKAIERRRVVIGDKESPMAILPKRSSVLPSPVPPTFNPRHMNSIRFGKQSAEVFAKKRLALIPVDPTVREDAVATDLSKLKEQVEEGNADNVQKLREGGKEGLGEDAGTVRDGKGEGSVLRKSRQVRSRGNTKGKGQLDVQKGSKAKGEKRVQKTKVKKHRTRKDGK